nr:MerR family transcriptional regulator [uncultured Roseateles sp.]
MNHADGSLRRSGAVARMLRMPVATLRVWERRYGLTQAKLSASGQRLYSDEDVRRLALIKQLTELGHAIGSLAGLDMAQLQRVGATHAGAQAIARRDAGPEAGGLSAPRPWRFAVIGAGLGARLSRPALLRRLGRPVQLLGPFDTVAQAAAALRRADVDALLIQEPQLHAGWLATLEASSPALAGLPTAVLYGFAAEAVCESLAALGITLLREPQPDVVLAQWLRQFGLATAAPPAQAGALAARVPVEPPRRWDDAALVEFAGRSSTVACECPRHVAELLMQLARFEHYSAECAHRNAADAELHAYLRQVSADSRARFEAALAQIALHEGLLLPAPRDS